MARRWVSLEEGCEISGHSSVRAFADWVVRWNLKNLDMLIMRRHGKVDTITLEAAIEEDAKQHTPGFYVAAAVIELKQRGTRRK